ncbi:MAG: acetylglutamate kinase [Solobacterium sp.]|nr:acetylglutamate kinase [Solobacterium sp.]
MNVNALDNSTRAELLVQALPYMKKYYGKTIVVKYGGNAMISDDLKEQVMEDVVLLSMVGIRVVLVHGGGPEVSDLMKRLGKEPEFVDGLRVTDAETVSIAQMVLAGRINKSLVSLLQMKGGNAVGLSGIDGRLIQAVQKDEKLGYVGTVTKVNPEPVLSLLDSGYIPVISTLGCDDGGNIYNINGDTAAGKIAAAVGAERLIMMTDIDGIRTDRHDPDTLQSELTVQAAQDLIADGSISGGMIPKVQCCIDALAEGVSAAVVIDGRVPHAILMEILTDEGAGTMFRKDTK